MLPSSRLSKRYPAVSPIGPISPIRPLGVSLFLVAALAAAPSWALTRSEQAEIHARYKQERAACMVKQDPADRSACLQDAVVGQAAALRDRPKDLDPNYAANQLKRCQALPVNLRKDCLSRMRGHGTVSGSVDSGGIYRELVTITPGAAVPAASPVPSVSDTAPSKN